ncbi:MAG: hypothetical protein V4495_30140 [Pseudomonadota bacterium]
MTNKIICAATLFLACALSWAATPPPCIPASLVAALPASAASAIAASTVGKPMQLAPFRHASANGQGLYWSCRMPSGGVQPVAYYATAAAWSDDHEQVNAQYRVWAAWDTFWSRLTGPSCWAPEAINSTDPQLKALCSELRVKAGALK